MRISQLVLCTALVGHSGVSNAFSSGGFKRPRIVPSKGETPDTADELPNKKNEGPLPPQQKKIPDKAPRTSITAASSAQPIVSGVRASTDRYQNSMSPWSAPSSATAHPQQQQQQQQQRNKPRMSRAASAIPIISSANSNSGGGAAGAGNDKPASFNTSGVSRGAVASMTSSAPPTGGTTVSHAAASTSGMSVGSVGAMTQSAPPTGGTTVAHASGTSAGTDVGSVGQMTSTQPPTGGTTVTRAIVSGDRACSDRYQNSMMNSEQGNRSATYKPQPRISRAAATIPVVGGGAVGGSGGGGAGGASAPTSNTGGVSRGSIASMTTSAPGGGGGPAAAASAAPPVAAATTPIVSGDRAADRYQNSLLMTPDLNRSSTYRGPAKVTRAAKTIPKLPDGSSAGGSAFGMAKRGAEDTDTTPKKMKPTSPPRNMVNDSLKPIISGQVGANVNDRYGNSMRPN